MRLAREADLVLVAPATANVLAKMANGLADDLLSAVLLTATCPIVVAPAMHTEMWEHAATRANLATLRERGLTVIDPEAGELAGGDEGVGRLAEPASIVEAVAATFAHGRDLAGVRMLVTAGGTQEPIDPVRFIGNRSSGKMGFAIATEAALRGAAVTLVTGPTWLEDPDRVEVVRIRTAAEMRDAVLGRFAEIGRGREGRRRRRLPPGERGRLEDQEGRGRFRRSPSSGPTTSWPSSAGRRRTSCSSGSRPRPTTPSLRDARSSRPSIST